MGLLATELSGLHHGGGYAVARQIVAAAKSRGEPEANALIAAAGGDECEWLEFKQSLGSGDGGLWNARRGILGLMHSYGGVLLLGVGQEKNVKFPKSFWHDLSAPAKSATHSTTSTSDARFNEGKRRDLEAKLLERLRWTPPAAGLEICDPPVHEWIQVLDEFELVTGAGRAIEFQWLEFHTNGHKGHVLALFILPWFGPMTQFRRVPAASAKGNKEAGVYVVLRSESTPFNHELRVQTASFSPFLLRDKLLLSVLLARRPRRYASLSQEAFRRSLPTPDARSDAVEWVLFNEAIEQLAAPTLLLLALLASFVLLAALFVAPALDFGDLGRVLQGHDWFVGLTVATSLLTLAFRLSRRRAVGHQSDGWWYPTVLLVLLATMVISTLSHGTARAHSLLGALTDPTLGFETSLTLFAVAFVVTGKSVVRLRDYPGRWVLSFCAFLTSLIVALADTDYQHKHAVPPIDMDIWMAWRATNVGTLVLSVLAAILVLSGMRFKAVCGLGTLLAIVGLFVRCLMGLPR